MTHANTLIEAVRQAWADVPAPATQDLQRMAWGWGEDAARTFTGIAPVDVDIHSHGFAAATPLRDLPPRAAAAYLGTYLIALLDGLALQRQLGLFADIVTRAHTLACLTSADFWTEVVRPHLAPAQLAVLAEVVRFLATQQQALALDDEQIRTMLDMALQDAGDRSASTEP